ncbi:hypothetical protein AGLY_008872 [Aphis glycines]|uniref:Uncharacterized protein n=1 Tax=Aphis glycines TaxID=307491 RepID=A0A6G0TJC2_APHGL|nr:hypothetical protein AGLY_008872 [Aphis glycines]
METTTVKVLKKKNQHYNWINGRQFTGWTVWVLLKKMSYKNNIKTKKKRATTYTNIFMNYTYKIICKYSYFDKFLSTFELQMLIVPMYSYNFLITIRITYEELCIKFSRPKKFFRHIKNIFSEKFKISVLKKIQNILKIKSCKENANLNYWKIFNIFNDYFLNYDHKKKSIWSKTGFA